jgi:hypothetical protein
MEHTILHKDSLNIVYVRRKREEKGPIGSWEAPLGLSKVRDLALTQIAYAAHVCKASHELTKPPDATPVFELKQGYLHNQRPLIPSGL